ncbi:hypothetical protein [Chryseobacterium sp. StRB126]|uniref:hypothetical protein n=1 Tax=Chryseobacterium sp. StRB126 TaxID=878220 RepID=UPI0005EE24FE|nr:hypothetical protein [Chryseobacterium sp. StRB126]
MGISFIIFIVIALIVFFIFRLKISKLQKVLWSVLAIIIVFSLIIYWFIQGFERGRDRLALPDGELNQPIK